MIFTTKDVSKKAITVEPTSTMSDARDIMIRHNISRVIVVSNDIPIGMVTEKGIASYLFKNSKQPLDEISISRAMRMPIVTVNPDTSIKRCAEVMIENDISSLVIRCIYRFTFTFIIHSTFVNDQEQDIPSGCH